MKLHPADVKFAAQQCAKYVLPRVESEMDTATFQELVEVVRGAIEVWDDERNPPVCPDATLTDEESERAHERRLSMGYGSDIDHDRQSLRDAGRGHLVR